MFIYNIIQKNMSEIINLLQIYNFIIRNKFNINKNFTKDEKTIHEIIACSKKINSLKLFKIYKINTDII